MSNQQNQSCVKYNGCGNPAQSQRENRGYGGRYGGRESRSHVQSSQGEEDDFSFDIYPNRIRGEIYQGTAQVMRLDGTEMKYAFPTRPVLRKGMSL